MARRREPTDLWATILEVVKAHQGSARVTRISYGAGMPVDRLKPILQRLAVLGLVRARVEEDHTTFEITPRGYEFVSLYWRLKAFTEEAPDPSGRRPPGYP